MKTSKRFLKPLITVLFFLFIIILLLEFFGLPFGSLFVRNVVNSYITNQYPKQELSIDKIYYNWVNSQYHTKILNKNGSVYTNIEYYWKVNALSDGRYNQIKDNLFDEEIKRIIKEHSPALLIKESTLLSRLKINIFRMNNLKKMDIIYITLQNKDETYVQTKKGFIELVDNILNYLQNNEYNTDKIQINYVDKNYIKDRSFFLKLYKAQMNLPIERIIKYVNSPSGTIYK
ncbi:MAG: hypothetical protein VR72_03420 [Clostridiaceae bacterium BRH_c20a]|nr:MAG: hypothetical protein VR72_03420 [Clostridiaceae bacterium BRH_c20a]